MKLNASNIVILMLETHNLTIITYSRNIQTIRKTTFIYYPGMISANLDTLRQFFKNRIVTKLSTRCSYSMINL